MSNRCRQFEIRWAHAGSEGFPVVDVYRDLDTLKRVAVVVEADKAIGEIVELFRAA